MTIKAVSLQAQWLSLPTVFGVVRLAWEETESGPRVLRILLPDAVAAAGDASSDSAPPAIADLGERIRAFLAGQAVDFDLELLALDRCPVFQRRVLLAEAAIPRGWVSTYGRIAAHLGVAGAGRAVGNALARNPFPIAIPCHRAVRANGGLGGYQGGLALKRALLTAEGVTVRADGNVLLERVWY